MKTFYDIEQMTDKQLLAVIGAAGIGTPSHVYRKDWSNEIEVYASAGMIEFSADRNGRLRINSNRKVFLFELVDSLNSII